MGFFQNLFGTGPDLKSIIADGAVIVDVRSPQEFREEHLKGSVNIPLDTINANLNKFKGHKNIIVCCRSGARSSSAKSMLEANGFSNVVNGGSWQNVASFLS